MLFRSILICAALVVCAAPSPASAAAAPGEIRVLSRDASFFRTVLRHTAGVEARFVAEATPATAAERAATKARRGDDPTVDRKGSQTATYAGGVALLGLAAYFIASSGGDDQLLAPNRDDKGGVDLPNDDPFVPPQPNLPGNPGQPGDPGQPGQPGGDGGDGSGDDEQQVIPDPTTVTPEPVSMTLMATGLAGMGVANLRRRRRRSS